MAEEILNVPVIVGDEEEILSFKLDDDVLTLELKGTVVCKASWFENMEDEFKRMLQIWGSNNAETHTTDSNES